MIVAFTVSGSPVGKQRARVVRRRNGSIGIFTPQATVTFEEAVATAARLAGMRMLDGAVGLDLVARWPYPAGWSKRARAEALEMEACGELVLKTTKPDLDNVVKAVADGLEGIAYPNDSRIAELRLAKAWGPVAETHVRVWQGHPPQWCAWWVDAARVRGAAA